MHVYNRLLENATFNDLFWVTVPQEFSVYELQTAIGDAASIVNLSKDKDVKRRAAKLFSHLEQKDKWVIILDGLWTHFKFEDVGIPKTMSGHKLVLTTRSLDVCRMMLCQEQIIIQPLWSHLKEDWSLFLQTISANKELSPEINEIAKLVVNKCGGLPLGIIEVATRMRGQENEREWRDKLEMLEESKLELEVFQAIEKSYRFLDDWKLQQCFLHCAFYCYNLVDKQKMVEPLIDEGLTHRIDDREKQHDKCCSMLDKLHSAFLLDNNDGWVKINPLFRDMALQMMSTKYMVKLMMNLEDVPDEEFWSNDLEKVSLAENHIKAIPPHFSPNCPKLTTLLLNGNETLEMISDPFFKHLLGLKVLNLSECRIKELPKSISNLVNLRALILRCCSALYHVPYLGKLRCLRKLDLRWCHVLEELPEGLENLVNLSYLDLLGTKIEKLPEGLLAVLKNLQYLGIDNVLLEAHTKLKKLEMVDGFFSQTEAFNACMKFILHNNLHKYMLRFNEFGNPHKDGRIDFTDQLCQVVIENCDLPIAVAKEGRSSNGCLLLPQNVNLLQMGGCIGPLEMGPLESLKYIELHHCHEMKQVVECERLPLLSSVRAIHVENCDEMEEIIAGSRLFVPQLKASFLLTHLSVFYCNKIRKLFRHELSIHLPNLEILEVSCCYGMEEIIGREGGEDERSTVTTSPCRFPKLKLLWLWGLPRLKSICGGVLFCDEIELIKLISCPELERVPLQCPPPPSLRKIVMRDEEEWESLEWGHPSSAFDKSLLRPLVNPLYG